MKTRKLRALPWILALLLAAGWLPAAQFEDDPYTSKFQNTESDEPEGPEAYGGKQGSGPERNRGRGPQISEEDRERMKSIQQKLSQNPDVQKAREEVQNAETPEEHREAMENMRKVMDKALSSSDRAFMEKMRKQHQKRSSGMKQRQRRGPDGGGAGGFGQDGPPEFGEGGPQGRGPGGPPDGQMPRGGGPGFGDDFQRGPRGGFGGGGGGGEPGRTQLTQEQRTRLKAIRAKYKDDPEVKAAREAVKEAITPEERELALDDYRETVRKKLNPEDREFLDEFRMNRMQQRPTQPPPGGERF